MRTRIVASQIDPGDQIRVGERDFIVVSNVEADSGNRIIKLKPGPFDTQLYFGLTLPAHTKVKVKMAK